MRPDEIASIYDAQTRALLRKKRGWSVCVLGNKEAPYLKTVLKKCSEFGVTTSLRGPIIVDTETSSFRDIIPEMDLDCVSNPGMSCTAQAVLDILANVGYKDVAIIGRGHAVKGLPEALLANDYTVTICHSKTKDICNAVRGSTVVVVAAPDVDDKLKEMLDSGVYCVIDVGGCIKYPSVNASQIARLNVSILFNRLARLERC